jgi:hypothetical protein
MSHCDRKVADARPPPPGFVGTGRVRHQPDNSTKAFCSKGLLPSIAALQACLLPVA